MSRPRFPPPQTNRRPDLQAGGQSRLGAVRVRDPRLTARILLTTFDTAQSPSSAATTPRSQGGGTGRRRSILPAWGATSPWCFCAAALPGRDGLAILRTVVPTGTRGRLEGVEGQNALGYSIRGVAQLT
jgi:hypothetical protein